LGQPSKSFAEEMSGEVSVECGTHPRDGRVTRGFRFRETEAADVHPTMEDFIDAT
jgi:hypothetical protein